MKKIKIIPSKKAKLKIKIEYSDHENSENLASIDYSKIPYCESMARGIDTPDCSEECCKFDTCIREERRNYKLSSDDTNLHINIGDSVYTYKEICDILKKHKSEEDKKYNTCFICGTKYLENKKFNMAHENLEEDIEREPGTALGYMIPPIITGFQINSTCGNGKKIKLCDDCITRFIYFLGNKGE